MSSSAIKRRAALVGRDICTPRRVAQTKEAVYDCGRKLRGRGGRSTSLPSPERESESGVCSTGRGRYRKSHASEERDEGGRMKDEPRKGFRCWVLGAGK